MTCYDHKYGHPFLRFRGIARWHAHLHGITTAIHEMYGLKQLTGVTTTSRIPGKWQQVHGTGLKVKKISTPWAKYHPNHTQST
jgi:hypothetical protein